MIVIFIDCRRPIACCCIESFFEQCRHDIRGRVLEPGGNANSEKQMFSLKSQVISLNIRGECFVDVLQRDNKCSGDARVEYCLVA